MVVSLIHLVVTMGVTASISISVNICAAFTGYHAFPWVPLLDVNVMALISVCKTLSVKLMYKLRLANKQEMGVK